MKFVTSLLVYTFVATLIGQTYGDLPTPPTLYPQPPVQGSTTTKPNGGQNMNTNLTYTPPRVSTTTEPTKPPCGSNNLGDYQGGCDESVPVIVLPKGRPIMEKILNWFKCNTEECRSKLK